VDFRAGGAKLTSRGEIYNLKVSGDDNTIDLRNGRGYSVALHGEDNDIVINSSIKFTGDGEHSGNTIQSFIDYHLDSAAQHLQLMGSAAEGNGNAWDNRLIGNDSDNVLNGRQGDDRLTGRDGNDRLTGGKGDDDFIFSKGNGKDVVTDFVAKSEPEIEHDKLVFRGYDLTSAERSDFLDDHARDEGGNVVITMGHQQIKLLDLHVSDLSNADIAWLT
jgi:Ca2+-binding RTX toxin-like protein